MARKQRIPTKHANDTNGKISISAIFASFGVFSGQ